MDVETLCAAFLHDTVEDTPVTSRAGEPTCSARSIAQLVDGVTEDHAHRGGEPLRRAGRHHPQDVRGHEQGHPRRRHQAGRPPAQHAHPGRARARTAASSRRARRWRSTRPSRTASASTSIKWELEDLAFFYLEPNKFKQVAPHGHRKPRRARGVLRPDHRASCDDEMEQGGHPGPDHGPAEAPVLHLPEDDEARAKGFSEIYDLIAVRIITQSVKDCYSALGAVHSLWHPHARPLQRLHRHAEVQHVPEPAHHGHRPGRDARLRCRSAPRRCTGASEYGVAAHWRYKEKGGKGGRCAGPRRLRSWLRKMLDWQEETRGLPRVPQRPDASTSAPTEVFVFTPKGEAMSLRRRRRPRSTSPTPSTPRWATTAWARR